MSIVFASVSSARDKAAVTKTKVQAKEIHKAIELSRLSSGSGLPINTAITPIKDLDVSSPVRTAIDPVLQLFQRYQYLSLVERVMTIIILVMV